MMEELNPDGLPVRTISPHSIDKSLYVGKYMEAFTTAMRKKWAGRLVYMDPFAGPGRCRVEGNDRDVPGSPLLALGVQHPFSRYYFGDKDPTVIEPLRRRTSAHCNGGLVTDVRGGEAHDNLIRWIGEEEGTSLTLAYLDPVGLDVEFRTVAALAGFSHLDVIQNIAIGTSLRRNMAQWWEAEEGKIDAWFGGREWRKIAEDHRHRPGHGADRIVAAYVEKLKTLGFLCDLRQSAEIRSHNRNLRLFRLVLASKHQLALDIWGDITLEDAGGQRRLRLNG